MNTEDSEFQRIEAEAKRRAAQKPSIITLQQAAQQALEALELLAKYENPATKIQVRKPKDGGPIVTMYPHKVATEAAAPLRERLAQPEHEPVAWKLVPIEPTNEMLKAMDQWSTEGYDERLLAGHAASVYMAAVEAAPTPPQRPWQGLTDDEIKALASWWPSYDQMPALMVLAKEIQENLKERNNG